MAKTSGQHPLGRFAEHLTCCSVLAKGVFKDADCKILLPDPPKVAGPWICLSGTSYQKEHGFGDRKLCDLLFAWDKAQSGKVSSPLDLKGGHVDVSEVCQQLQNGAEILTGLLEGIEVRFLPVLVCQSIRKREAEMLKRERVTFRGQRHRILAVKSGARIDGIAW